MGIFSIDTVSAACGTGGKPAAQFAQEFNTKEFIDTMRNDIAGSIQKCITTKNPASITDFYCPPSGSKVSDDARAINENTLPYAIAVDRLFTRIDTEISLYMESLQCLRDTDGAKWTSDIRGQIEGTANSAGFGPLYSQVCTMGYIEQILNSTDYPINKTVTYPQSICRDKAIRKTQAWINLGYMLMKGGIEKGYQNNKDKMIDKVKGAYGRVLLKFHSYFEAFGQAASKIQTQIKQTNQ